MKTLVLYYSRTGNTKFVADEIAKKLGADIEEIAEAEDRKGLRGYLRAGKETLLKSKSKIKPLKHKIEDYDVIYIGQPIWAWNVIPPIRGLLHRYRFTGKKVGLFCTMGGSGDKRCFKSMREALISSEIIGELTCLEPLKNKEQKEAAEKKIEKFTCMS